MAEDCFCNEEEGGGLCRDVRHFRLRSQWLLVFRDTVKGKKTQKNKCRASAGHTLVRANGEPHIAVSSVTFQKNTSNINSDKTPGTLQG